MTDKTASKQDIIDSVAEKAGITKEAAKTALNAVLDTLTEKLAAGYEVPFAGFGKFSVGFRPEREGRNPTTGAALTVAAANVPKFSAGKALKDAVNVKA